MSVEREGARRLPPNYLVVNEHKPMKAYVLSGTVQLSISDKLVLFARGRSISKAVDVALSILSRLGDRASLSSIKIGSEQTSKGKYVSTIEIVIESVQKKL